MKKATAIILRALFFSVGILTPVVTALADEPAADSFSERASIEKRLEAVGAELKALPEDAVPALRERLEQLQAAGQYHLAAVDFLAA